jgi:acetyltransferase-like isoleucine patch superfamily enzyme
MSALNQELIAKYPGAAVAEGATIHERCSIGQEAEISAEAVLESDVVVANNAKIIGKVRIESGVTVDAFSILFGPLHIGENTIIGSGVVIGLVGSESERQETQIMESCRVGKFTHILGGLQVGRHARIRSGSLVRGDVPAYGLVSQNPALLERYACPKCGGLLEQVRLNWGVLDAHCSDCGAGEFQFADLFWKNAWNRVLLPNQTLGDASPGFGDDQHWCDETEMG